MLLLRVNIYSLKIIFNFFKVKIVNFQTKFINVVTIRSRFCKRDGTGVTIRDKNVFEKRSFIFGY